MSIIQPRKTENTEIRKMGDLGKLIYEWVKYDGLSVATNVGGNGPVWHLFLGDIIADSRATSPGIRIKQG